MDEKTLEIKTYLLGCYAGFCDDEDLAESGEVICAKSVMVRQQDDLLNILQDHFGDVWKDFWAEVVMHIQSVSLALYNGNELVFYRLENGSLVQCLLLSLNNRKLEEKVKGCFVKKRGLSVTDKEPA